MKAFSYFIYHLIGFNFTASWLLGTWLMFKLEYYIPGFQILIMGYGFQMVDYSISHLLNFDEIERKTRTKLKIIALLITIIIYGGICYYANSLIITNNGSLNFKV